MGNERRRARAAPNVFGVGQTYVCQRRRSKSHSRSRISGGCNLSFETTLGVVKTFSSKLATRNSREPDFPLDHTLLVEHRESSESCEETLESRKPRLASGGEVQQSMLSRNWDGPMPNGAQRSGIRIQLPCRQRLSAILGRCRLLP